MTGAASFSANRIVAVWAASLSAVIVHNAMYDYAPAAAATRWQGTLTGCTALLAVNVGLAALLPCVGVRPLSADLPVPRGLG